MAATNSRSLHHRTSGLSVDSGLKVQQAFDDFETSQIFDRYKRCGGPPTVKPPTVRPPPPPPKEGEKPPEPIKQPQIKTQPCIFGLAKDHYSQIVATAMGNNNTKRSFTQDMNGDDCYEKLGDIRDYGRWLKDK